MKKNPQIILFAIVASLIVAFNYFQSTKIQESHAINPSSQVKYEASLSPFSLVQMATSISLDKTYTPSSVLTNTETPLSCCLNVQRVHIPNYIHNAVIENRGEEEILANSGPSVNATNIPGIHISKYISKRIADK